MIKVAWDVEELVALIDVYRKSDGKTTDQIEKELMDLSKSLTLRAQKLGIKHDEKFLNLMSTEQKKGHVISRNSAVSAV